MRGFGYGPAEINPRILLDPFNINHFDWSPAGTTSIPNPFVDFGDNPAAANVNKLAANFLIASAMEALAEAFTFVSKNGADPNPLLEAVGSTLFACPIYQNYGRQIIEKRYREPMQ